MIKKEKNAWSVEDEDVQVDTEAIKTSLEKKWHAVHEIIYRLVVPLESHIVSLRMKNRSSAFRVDLSLSIPL